MGSTNLHVRASIPAHVLKSAVVHVPKNSVRLPVMLLTIQISILTHVRVRREQVLVTIVVEILNSGSPAAHFKAAKSDTCLVTFVAEKTVAFVAEERIGFAAKCGDDQAGFAIIVPVAKIHAHAGDGQSAVGVCDERLDPHLIECLSSAVFEKKISVVVVGDENIHPAVIVVVGHRYAHAFANIPGDAHDF